MLRQEMKEELLLEKEQLQLEEEKLSKEEQDCRNLAEQKKTEKYRVHNKICHINSMLEYFKEDEEA